MWDLKGRLRSALEWAGKGDRKVASVFASDAAASQRAVAHLREGVPEIPIWLFTPVPPVPETAAMCESVFIDTNTLALAAEAQSRLWPYSVAISVGAWTGSRGNWALKLAPFFIPPCRVLILNRAGGFFQASPKNIGIHVGRGMSDAFHLAWGRVGDLWNGLGKLASATALLALATFLRWLSNPHLRIFGWLRRDQPLMLEVESSTGSSIVEFTQGGPHWNAEALEQAARSSGARWLLWHTEAYPDRLGDGFVLFDDSRTFAVSRQVHFRAWKKTIVATAPFRTLKQGEAARVLAPLSDSILIDRKKLLALGIPRSTLAGTAWMILFWKAAAAGWHSFSVGENTPLHEQPDFPIQDTAFFLKTFFDPALRRLTSRDEDLSGGNIAFSPAFTYTPESSRLKVLIVSPFLPYPLSHGGAVRMYNLCRELSDRVDFTLIAMRESTDAVNYAKMHEVFREVYIVDQDERPRASDHLPAQVRMSESRSLRALIRQLSQKLLPDVIQFEYTHFAGFRDSAPAIPALLVEHDLTFSLYRQLAEKNPTRESSREFEKWLAFERKWLAEYEGVWTVSDADRLLAIEESGRDPGRTFAIPNGVDLQRFHPNDDHRTAPEVLYVGSLRHLPNVIGFEKLSKEIMPRVWAKAPETRLRVVAGPDHERYLRPSNVDRRIEIHGFVEDLRPLYANASVVAVSLEVSAGTNIKVLEAMACGKAIVSTAIGCAGFDVVDGSDILIRDGHEAFADAICAVLSGAISAADLGERARRTVENRFGWSAIADRAYESYIAIAGRPADVIQSETASRARRALATRN